MGLYERDYGRDDNLMPWERYEREQKSQQPKGMVIILIVITAVIFLVDLFTGTKVEVQGETIRVSRLAEWFATRHDTLIQPWTWFQFLTYGFLHDVNRLLHVGFNMLALFVFGRPVEQRLGRGEFLRFYLLSMFVGGVIGSATFWITGEPNGGVIGASGAVLAVTILFACYHPHEKVLLMMVIPIKAWILATIFVAGDLLGTLAMISEANEATQGAQSSGGTAFTVHLAGAAFGLLYYFQRWNLSWLDMTEWKDKLRRSATRTRLKIHDPDRKLAEQEEEADRILEKIHRSGEDSLTSAERRTLQKYSKRKRESRGD